MDRVLELAIFSRYVSPFNCAQRYRTEYHDAPQAEDTEPRPSFFEIFHKILKAKHNKAQHFALTSVEITFSEYSTTFTADFSKHISNSIFGVFTSSLRYNGGGDCINLG